MYPLPAFLAILLAGGPPGSKAGTTGTTTRAIEGDGASVSVSRWSRRTSKKRQRTEQLICNIEQRSSMLPPHRDLLQAHHGHAPTSLVRPTGIDWDQVDPALDPMKGGRIRQGSLRGERKRAQVEAIATIVSKLLRCPDFCTSGGSGTTIINAGSGAGNLAIPLAGLLRREGISNFDVLAVDVNEVALQRLEERASGIFSRGTVRTLFADLARPYEILQQMPGGRSCIVVSLHACGAASDYAMELAHISGSPFIICPCCTAKSLVRRRQGGQGPAQRDAVQNNVTTDISASFQRSGATDDIRYPRSDWLCGIIPPDMEDNYEVLAKVADVGLGPQTPSEQREHQRRAKIIVELDRLASSAENFGYYTRLVRIKDQGKVAYGKGEILLGAKEGSSSACVLRNLPVIVGRAASNTS